MKLRYLHKNNCKELLSSLFDFDNQIKEFDNYLEMVNSNNDEKGLIEKLIQKNKETQGKKSWTRLLTYDADIGFEYEVGLGRINYCLKPYYKYPDLSRSQKEQRVVAQFWQCYEDGTKWGYKMPMQCLLKNWGNAGKGYKCYVHSISNGLDVKSSDFKEIFYVGITKRNWLKRLDEHLYEMRSGSKKLFHKAWRDSLGAENIIYGSELMDINATYEIAMSWEEWFVDAFSLSPKGLNMIPGGLKGLKFLYEHRLTDKIEISLEERERAIANYVRQNPRKGIPNPFIAALWEDDEYYLKIIGAREKTLSPSQVKRIRHLASLGWDIERIMEDVNALSKCLK
jgi:hypothetical protein